MWIFLIVLFLPITAFIVAGLARIGYHFRLIKPHKNSSEETRKKEMNNLKVMFGISFYLFLIIAMIEYNFIEKLDRYLGTNISFYEKYQSAYFKENWTFDSSVKLTTPTELFAVFCSSILTIILAIVLANLSAVVLKMIANVDKYSK